MHSKATDRYLSEVFGRQDEHLAGLMPRAVEAGLPDIAVSPEVGRLIKLLTGLSAPGGARVGIELGTLGGYSGVWIARGLAPGGRLITIESVQKHADFARGEFERAGVGDMVEIRVGAALEVLPILADELGEGSVDFAFFDAIKAEYPAYLERIRPMLRVGGILMADNALGGGWSITDPPGSSPQRDGMVRFNQMIADDPMFEAVCVPIRSGLVVARKITE